jgi:hypothetical protein
VGVCGGGADVAPCPEFRTGRPPCWAIRRGRGKDIRKQGWDAAVEMTRWEALVRYDDEIREAAARLTPYGSVWVDKLGEAFFALNEDRKYLSNIVDGLVREAEHAEIVNWVSTFSKTADGAFVLSRGTSTTHLWSNADIIRFGGVLSRSEPTRCGIPWAPRTRREARTAAFAAGVPHGQNNAWADSAESPPARCGGTRLGVLPIREFVGVLAACAGLGAWLVSRSKLRLRCGRKCGPLPPIPLNSLISLR